MNNFVTPETAQSLADAGFPQLFAPGIADLLHELGPGWAIQKGGDASWCAFSKEHAFVDKHPAEALAAAWLFLSDLESKEQ